MLVNTFLILFLVCFSLFLFQIAVQFIKLERRLVNTVEVLEEELIDVFGISPADAAEKEAPVEKKEEKPSPLALLAAVKAPETPKKKPAKGRK